MANVHGLDEPFALAPAVAAALGVPAVLGNDVNVAVEAERRFGAGRGCAPSSASSGGRVSEAGSSSTAACCTGAAPPARSATCARSRAAGAATAACEGCVEAYAGRGALEERARKESRKRETVLFDLMHKRGRDRLTSGVWLRALEAGDDVAHELLGEAVEALGVGIGSAVTLLDVEAVVLGGGLGERLGPAG